MAHEPKPTPRTGPRPDVVASVEIPGGPLVQGKVTKVDHHVVTVEFARKGAPVIPIARQATLSFSSADLQKPLSARSRVIVRRDDDEKICYDFQFHPIDGETLNAVFRRRTAARVKPPEVVAVTAKTSYDDKSAGVSALLNDVSLTGLSISMGCQGEAQLCNHDRVLLSFRLPGVDTAIELVGFVRYRRMAGTMIRYGVEFDNAATKNYAQQEERIAAYMVKRKAEAVQQTLGTRAA